MSFGSFVDVCKEVSLPLCGLVEDRLEPVCFARNVELNGTILFQASTAIVHAISWIMIGIMVYQIKSKYTAVGRKEMVFFFYLVLATIVVEFLIVFGIMQLSLDVYPFAVAVEIGLITTTLWCLMLNGFVAFQWAEDGTPLSLWSIRLSSLAIFVISFVVSIATFRSFLGFNSSNTTVLFILYFVFNGALVVTYTISQAVMVLTRLTTWWPLGDLGFAALFFIMGQASFWLFSVEICTSFQHYIDGMFFGSIFNFLALMMVYKYWNSINTDDLEFTVAPKMNSWEVREPLMKDEHPPQQQMHGTPVQYAQQNSYDQSGYSSQGMYPQQGQQVRPQY